MTLKEFASIHNLTYGTVKNHIRMGRCAWPRETHDGKRKHPLYNTWRAMIRRCHDKKYDSYSYYGERGITVCYEWRTNFWQFVNDMDDRPEGFTLDRIDNDKGYHKDNCRWASRHDQRMNQRRQL